MPWFNLNAPSDALLLKTYELFDGHAPLVLTSEKAARFGHKNNVPVHTVAQTEQLMNLHRSLYYKINALGGKHIEPQWVGSHYNPHVSNVGKKMFLPGQKVTVNEILIFERMLDPQGKERKYASVVIRLW